MALKNITLTMAPEDIIRLMRAALDEDAGEALMLVRDILYPRLVKELDKTR